MAASMRRRATVSLPAFAGHIGDRIIHNFNTYEDYLDSQITANDLFYLEDVDLARQLVELGYRSNAEIMTRDQFINLKEDAEQAHSQVICLRAKEPKHELFHSPRSWVNTCFHVESLTPIFWSLESLASQHEVAILFL
ncbi:hypothetical protein O6H91_20G039500 [Diphasiastrum complanatum]|uniref:Uncharacterized protein n=1 Tax=Diphasiastrum complanatum TaxID=34168 RepID=A0ACC2APC8_DIPCM|nr:hypothetical protein O6H91_20G039500 [Diphasiastrum complanatum]